ncbi:uncharacterized protein M421DRAFT_103672 [Didymella exigua CBS 183.55]|uniref:DUF3253 domain-containing protein n=1 Tax=Didymella exigua CBS 183.55 TaxID=1150837 RepID=A0A6A5RBF0_9PLEO|nr:uncharacterized protein M421DRAFT_103672 [Didymella exigua CBS 183.55]KAF1924528.1 hypothetical protein M421DRAFT_103672 [Didymella exigua CBS 183.55]
MALDDQQREIILGHTRRLISSRDYPKTVCPSEIARAMSASDLSTLDALDWRATMVDIRELVWELREQGEVEVLQKGEVLDVESLSDIRGPIRVRKVQTQ